MNPFSPKSQTYGLGQSPGSIHFGTVSERIYNSRYGKGVPRRQCLPLSVVQLQGKHCRKPHCRNGVVDTFRPWVPCPCFPLINHYYYKKSKTLYPNPKYLFGIGIWIWATKNLGSCVRSLCQRSSAGMTMRIGVALWTHWEKIMFSNSIQSLSIFAWAQWEK